MPATPRRRTGSAPISRRTSSRGRCWRTTRHHHRRGAGRARPALVRRRGDRPGRARRADADGAAPGRADRRQPARAGGEPHRARISGLRARHGGITAGEAEFAQRGAGRSAHDGGPAATPRTRPWTRCARSSSAPRRRIAARVPRRDRSAARSCTSRPASSTPRWCGACARPPAALGHSHRDIVSGAAHDAVYLARIAPTAMVFVPCAGGISHNEIESATPAGPRRRLRRAAACGAEGRRRRRRLARRRLRRKAMNDRATAPTLEDSAFFMPFSMNRQFKKAPRLLARAEGMHYYTPEGRKLLDGTSGLWCVNAGHCRPRRSSRRCRSRSREIDFAPTFQMGHPLAFEFADRTRSARAGRPEARVLHQFGFRIGGHGAQDRARLPSRARRGPPHPPDRARARLPRRQFRRHCGGRHRRQPQDLRPAGRPAWTTSGTRTTWRRTPSRAGSRSTAPSSPTTSSACARCTTLPPSRR